MKQRNSVPAVDISQCIGQGKASLSRTIRRRSTECVILYKPKFESPVVGGPTHGNVKRLIMLFEELKKNKENEHLHPRPSARTEIKCSDSYCRTTEWNQKRDSSQKVYPKPETNSIIKTTNYKSFGLGFGESSQNSVEFINDSLQATRIVFKMLVINFNGDRNESEPNLEDEEARNPSIIIYKN